MFGNDILEASNQLVVAGSFGSDILESYNQQVKCIILFHNFIISQIEH